MHNISYNSYSENFDHGEIESTLQEIAIRDGDGLYEPIQWRKEIFDSEDEANDFIKKHDYSYANIAVRYKVPNKIKHSKEYNQLSKKLAVLMNKRASLDGRQYFKDAKSNLIGCKKCGSKIARAYLKSNYCPICKNDLRPESFIKKVQNLKDEEKALKTQLNEVKKKDYKASLIKGYKINWLIKIEYHS